MKRITRDRHLTTKEAAKFKAIREKIDKEKPEINARIVHRRGTNRPDDGGKDTNDREGAPPVELVDGEKLVELFERVELGLKPKTVYEVDHEFFAPFLPNET